MAVTGLIMIGFLVMHMYGNLKVFMGAESFDHYAHWLKGDILYPLVPSGWFIWIFRFFLLAAVLAHVWSAWHLARKAKAARGSSYVVKKSIQQTYSARTMRWGGVILAAGLVFHILQFTALVIRTGFTSESGPYEMFVLSFQQWWLVLVYAAWMVTVCMRYVIAERLASARTPSTEARSVLNALGLNALALLLSGVKIAPLAVLFGVVK